MQVNLQSLANRSSVPLDPSNASGARSSNALQSAAARSVELFASRSASSDVYGLSGPFSASRQRPLVMPTVVGASMRASPSGPESGADEIANQARTDATTVRGAGAAERVRTASVDSSTEEAIESADGAAPSDDEMEVSEQADGASAADRNPDPGAVSFGFAFMGNADALQGFRIDFKDGSGNKVDFDVNDLSKPLSGADWARVDKSNISFVRGEQTVQGEAMSDGQKTLAVAFRGQDAQGRAFNLVMMVNEEGSAPAGFDGAAAKQVNPEGPEMEPDTPVDPRSQGLGVASDLMLGLSLDMQMEQQQQLLNMVDSLATATSQNTGSKDDQASTRNTEDPTVASDSQPEQPLSVRSREFAQLWASAEQPTPASELYAVA